jgi:ABC-type transporter Mla subunit MlaD
MSLCVTEEAIQALKAANSKVNELHIELLQQAKALILTYGNNQTGLGRHNNSIETLIQQLVDTSGDEKEVKRLVKKLTRVSNTIADHIKHDLYKGKTR